MKNAIVFHDPRNQTNIIAPHYGEPNAYNSRRTTMTVQPGTLILFPAWLSHSVPPNGSDQERVSREIIEFCGLPWDDRCLRFYQNKRVVQTSSYDQVTRPTQNAQRREKAQEGRRQTEPDPGAR